MSEVPLSPVELWAFTLCRTAQVYLLYKYLSHTSLMPLLENVGLGDEHPGHSQKGNEQQEHLYHRDSDLRLYDFE